jgi:hypothetical protein
MSKLELLLRIAGVLHFCILIASGLVPVVLDWRATLAALNPFLRRLFWVYGGFVVLMIVGLGTLTLLNARAMAEGEPVARTLAGFTALFWLARLGVQFFVFDARAYLTNWFLKSGYHGLTLVFTYFVVIYGWVAINAGH